MAELYIEKEMDEATHRMKKLLDNMIINNEKYETKTEEKEEKKDNYKTEQEKIKKRIYDCVMQIRLYLIELEIEKLIDKTNKIIKALKSFDVLTKDYTKYISAMGKYINEINDRHKIDSAALGRLWNHVKMGYFPTDLDNLDAIKKGIKYPENISVNILDPCVGCGLALEYISNGYNTFTYGAEIDEARAEEARSRVFKIAKGSFFGSRVSREAFHMLFLNPPYLTIKNEVGTSIRLEKKFLVETIYHLMYGGIIIYIIPFYRVTQDIARILADNFSDIKAYKFTKNEFKKFKQIAIIGKRIKKRNGIEYAKEIINIADKINEMKEVTEILEKSFLLPNIEKDVSVFKGSIFDVKELEEQLKSSNLINKIFDESELDNTDKRPLLPFTIGQIGLIGGSGLINGYIDCDVPHVLKGQIIKERKTIDSKEDIKGKEIEVTEAVVNKMNFNILTIDGIKKLA